MTPVFLIQCVSATLYLNSNRNDPKNRTLIDKKDECLNHSMYVTFSDFKLDHLQKELVKFTSDSYYTPTSPEKRKKKRSMEKSVKNVYVSLSIIAKIGKDVQ